MTPKRLDDMLQMSESEFEELLARAAQEGARRALVDAGLDGREAALDIRDLRALLEGIRLMRRTAAQTIIRMLSAGLILTLAVAVDANVLIYERMRDEARQGRSVIASLDAGFNKAMGTIIDANLTTLVAALIMFFFGAGPVRGFAWTLSIGVFTSMLSAVLVAQVGLAWWLKVAKPKKLPVAE